MSNEPHIEQRAERPYAAIAVTTSLAQEAQVVPALLGELRRWLAGQGRTANGAPFVRYWTIEMPDRLAIEVCLPASEVTGDDRVRTGVLPAGPYVVLVHRGPHAELVAANERLQQWAKAHDVRFQMSEAGAWGARVETYLRDPAAEPPETELAYLVAAR